MKRPRPLPAQISRLLDALEAPRRLVAHLMLVHDTACDIVARFNQRWPVLRYDREAVRLGAAIHDIGKCVVPSEITGPGHAHEVAGEALLIAHGWPVALARFARTHARWAELSEPSLEDLLVALADTWWRGRRDEMLERRLRELIAREASRPEWEVTVIAGEIGDAVAADADERLAWQSLHTI